MYVFKLVVKVGQPKLFVIDLNFAFQFTVNQNQV